MSVSFSGGQLFLAIVLHLARSSFRQRIPPTTQTSRSTRAAAGTHVRAGDGRVGAKLATGSSKGEIPATGAQVVAGDGGDVLLEVRPLLVAGFLSRMHQDAATHLFR